MKRRLQYVLAVVTLAIAVSLAGCGDDDGGSASDAGERSSAPMTQEQARRIAESVLLIKEDLPVASWQLEEPEEEDESDPFAGVPECEELAAIFGSDDDVAQGSLASAERGYVSEIALSYRTVQSSSEVFASAEEANAVYVVASGLFSPEALGPCFAGAFRDMFEAEGLTVRRIDVRKPDFAVKDAAALRVEFDVQAGFVPIKGQLEMHLFQRDRIVAGLMWMDMNSDLLGKSQRAMLEQFETKVRKASS